MGTYCEDQRSRRVKDLCCGVAYCKAVRLSERQAHLLPNLTRIQDKLQSELTQLVWSMDVEKQRLCFGDMFSESTKNGGLSALGLKVFLGADGRKSEITANLCQKIDA